MRQTFLLLSALLLSASCATKLAREDVLSSKSVLGFPSAPIGAADVAKWYRDVADPRSSSLDLDSPSPYVETALAPTSPYERVGLFLERDSLRVAAVLSWLHTSDAEPQTKGQSGLRLWGMDLEKTANDQELYAPAARAMLRIVNPYWRPPAEPRVQLPGDVPVKTATRTFYRDQLFALVDGQIFFKRNPHDGGLESEPWRLFGDGLPDVPGSAEPFDHPKKIVRLTADGDDLVAIDDRGRVYTCSTKSDSMGSASGWSDGWGFPKRPLVVSGRATNARALSIGRRAQDVVWFEDAIGNRHNWGPMGTTTFYVLHQNGQEILYTDNGLPNDVSREICGPDDGRFIADSLSASASAIMVMDRFGRVFTRFEDYDLNGGTPNFDYTYRTDVRPDEDGTKLRSSMAPYYLPLQPWQWQPSIPLVGHSRLSKQITILQTGVGNDARELRVAGIGPNGDRGYFRKPINAGEWRFVATDDVGIDAASLLDDADLARGTQDRVDAAADISRSSLPRGSAYRGVWHGVFDAGLPGVSLVLDWNPYCPPGRLTFSYDGQSFPATLHTVDFWTPAHRSRPGFDGTPLVLLGTLVLDRDVLTDTRPAVRAVVEMLRAYHQRTFALALVMDGDKLDVTPLDQEFATRHPLHLALTREGERLLPDPAPTGLSAPRGSVAWLRSRDLHLVAETPALVVDVKTASPDQLGRAIAANRALVAELRDDLSAASSQFRELDSFLDSTKGTRLVARVVPLGRMPEMTRLLDFQREVALRTYSEAEANVEAVVNELNDRIASYEAAQRR